MNLVCHCRREIVQSIEMAVVLCVNQKPNHLNIFTQQLKHFTMSPDRFMQKYGKNVKERKKESERNGEKKCYVIGKRRN